MIEFTPMPEVFIRDGLYNSEKIDDIIFVKYVNNFNISLFKMNVRTNMFIVVLEGKKVVYKPKETLTIVTGEAFFIPNGSHLLSEVISEAKKFRSLMFFLTEEYIDRFLDKHVEYNLDTDSETRKYKPEVFKLDIENPHCHSLKSITPYFLENQQYKDDDFKDRLEEMLLLLLSTEDGLNHFSRLKNRLTPDTIDLAQYMDQNYTKPFTVDKFATESGNSLSTFKRYFKEVFNTTPKRWINEKRLNLAYVLLQNTDITISDLCFKVGYSNLSYFIQLFKTKYGITPKKFRLSQNQQK